MAQIILTYNNWQELLTRDDLIGGDFQWRHRGNRLYRGRIVWIDNRTHYAKFLFAWSAHFTTSYQEWCCRELDRVFVHAEKIALFDDGRILIKAGYSHQPSGNCYIYPKGSGELPWEKVLSPRGKSGKRK